MTGQEDDRERQMQEAASFLQQVRTSETEAEHSPHGRSAEGGYLGAEIRERIRLIADNNKIIKAVMEELEPDKSEHYNVRDLFFQFERLCNTKNKAIDIDNNRLREGVMMCLVQELKANIDACRDVPSGSRKDNLVYQRLFPFTVSHGNISDTIKGIKSSAWTSVLREISTHFSPSENPSKGRG